MVRRLRKVIVIAMIFCLMLSAVPAKAMVPPTTVYFESWDEIVAYFDMSAGNSPGDAREGVRDHCTEQLAQEICDAMDSLVFPYLEIDGKPAKLSASWTPGRRCLDVIYVVDEIQYRFRYYFFSDDQGTKEEPAVRNVRVGPYQLDFRRKEHPNSDYLYLSAVWEGSTNVCFWVASDREDCLNFERFRFVRMSELKEEPQQRENLRVVLISTVVVLTGVAAVLVLRKRKSKVQENPQAFDEI